MDRRHFLKSTAALTAASVVSPKIIAADKTAESNEGNGKLITSAPMLQNYAATSMGIAFSVSAFANGYVYLSEKEDMSDAKMVKCGGYRVTAADDKVIQVRLTGLKEATKYYYTIGADRIDYKNGHNMHIIGSETDPTVYSFTTAGKNAKAHFCVINDTHANFKTFAALTEIIHKIQPSCTIWNGDVHSSAEDIETQRKVFLYPELGRKDYASCTPYLFCPGNHDSRGMANRHIERVWMFRQPEERSSRDWDLGRNFAVRMGDIAMIGLDTAEDKVDENPLYAGLFNSGPYREAQVEWLKDALKQKEIASAPFLVTFCHIPLFDSDPTHNPGDVHPNDTDPRYSDNYAYWQRTCAQLWTPMLQEAGCQLIITAHKHRYRYDAPDAQRKWGQIVGGSNNLEGEETFATVIEGLVDNGKLIIKIIKAATGQVVATHTYNPKK